MTDAELIEVATEFRDGMLGSDAPGDGQCAKVSWALAGYLRSLCDIDCETVQSDHSDMATDYIEHVWIKLADGRALDATYDQFCSEEPVKVYLGAPTEFHVEPHPREEITL